MKLLILFCVVFIQFTSSLHTISLTSECSTYKAEFASLASNVTLCFIKSSQPLRICENCLYQYKAFLKKYDELRNKTEHVDFYCGSELLYSEVLSIVSDLYDMLTEEWKKINCDNCYVDKSRNPIFSNFLQYEDEMMLCFLNYTDANLDYRSSTFETDWKDKYFNRSACFECNNQYKEVNDYYISVENNMEKVEPMKLWKGICGDMGEMMNMTRYLWSKKFSCNRDSIEWYMAIGPICTVVAMLLIFYCMVSTYFHNKIDMIMYKQRRLKPYLEAMDGTLLNTVN